MRSIRNQLLIWLLPSFILIAILASSALYFSEKLRLETNLDNELSKLARAVKLVHNMPRNRLGGPGGGRLSTTERINFLRDDESSEFYLQIWDETEQVVSKSKNLDKEELMLVRAQTQTSGNKTHYDSSFSSGENIRLYSFTILAGPLSSDKYATVAMSKSLVNRQLHHFTVKVIIGSAFCCLLLSVILIFVIKRTLTPVHKLAEQLICIEAGSLDYRLDSDVVPAEISPLVERLNQLLARLAQSFVKERQFSNDLAHELRTPLAAIRTTSEVALKWPEQSTIEDHQYIAESAEQLHNTIDSLLSLARIESAGQEFAFECVDIATIVTECISLKAEQIKKRRLRVTLSANNPHIIKSDPYLLRIIISNLINNAVEYAPTNTEVSINANLKDSLLTVSNSAPNLNDNDIKAMFDRLWRKDGSRTDKTHVGLGLSIAYTASQALSLNLIATLSNDKLLHLSLMKR